MRVTNVRTLGLLATHALTALALVACSDSSPPATDTPGGSRDAATGGDGTIGPDTASTTSDSAVKDAAVDGWDPCVAGVCPEVLATVPGSPMAIAVDAHNVYWTALFQDFIGQVPISGGTASQFGQVNDVAGGGLAVDAKNAYFTLNSGLRQVPLGSNDSIALTPISTGGEFVVVNATDVYWVTGGSGLVRKVPIGGPPDGGMATTLFKWTINERPTGLAIDATNLYYGVANGYPTGIMKMPLAGGTATVVAETDDPVDIAVDATTIYYATKSNIAKVPIGGGPVTNLFQGTPHRIAVDANYVYYTVRVTPALMKVPINGGTPIKIAGGSPWLIALDANNIYWLDDGPYVSGQDPKGYVMKLAK
jgi:hypothetical protein